MIKRIIAIALSPLLLGLMMVFGVAGIASAKAEAAVPSSPEPCSVGEMWTGSQCVSVQTLYDKCRKKSAEQQDFCITVVDSRLKEIGAFLATKRFVQPNPKAGRRFEASLSNAVGVPSAAQRFDASEKVSIEAHVYQEILAGIPALATNESLPKYVCAVSDLGWARCLGTDAIVGFFDNVQAAKAVKDIETMVGRLTQEEKYKGVLISCPLGRFGTANLEELFGLVDGGGINPPTPPGGEASHLALPGSVGAPPSFEQLLGGKGDNAITKYCSNLISSSTSGGGTGSSHMSGSVGGYGGIGGGFRSFDGGFCGFQLGSGGSIESMNIGSEALNMMNEAMRYCGTSTNAGPWDDIRAGWESFKKALKRLLGINGSGDASPKPNPKPNPEQTPNSKPKPESEKKPEDVLELLPPNYYRDQYILSIADGREVKVVLEDQGIYRQGYLVIWKDGSETWVWGTESGYKSKEKSSAGNKGGQNYDCGRDDQCSTCRDFSQFFPKSFETCQLSGSTSLACQRFEDMLGCCGNSSGRFPGDPRIMIPNPEGDLFCMGTPNRSLREEFCAKQCSIVTPVDGGDCESTCLSRSSAPRFSLEQFRTHLWDDVCLHGYSENCFQATGLPLPNSPRPENPPNVPKPPQASPSGLPSPVDQTFDVPSHTLLPTTAFDRQAPKITIDLFADVAPLPSQGIAQRLPEGVREGGGSPSPQQEPANGWVD